MTKRSSHQSKRKFSWKKILRICGIYVGVLLSAILIGASSLYVSYCLSTDHMDHNIATSVDDIEYDTTHWFLSTKIYGTIDYFTDSLMLLEATTNGSPSTLSSTMLNSYSYIGTGAVDTLSPSDFLIWHYRDNQPFDGYFNYGRYWHGYLIFLKPLLILTNYNGIRIINFIAQSVLIIAVIYQLCKQKKKLYIVPYALSILMLMPLTNILCLQDSACFYIFNIGCLILLLLKKFTPLKISLLFFILGISTAFFDLLSYPLVTFGMPFILFLCLYPKEKCKEHFSMLIKCGCSWIIGYVGMWFSKWILGSVILKTNIISDALNTLLFRTSGEAGSRLETIWRNVATFFHTPITYCVLLVLIIGIVYIIIRAFTQHISPKKLLFTVLPFLIIAMIPFIWYIVANNHSYIHYHLFANKILVITVFALICAVVKIIYLYLPPSSIKILRERLSRSKKKCAKKHS